MPGRVLQLAEHALDLAERFVIAIERIATANERSVGIARTRKASKPRRVARDVPIDDVSRARATQIARASGFKVDE